MAMEVRLSDSQEDRDMKRLGTIATMLSAVALAGGLTVGMTGAAHADVIPPANTWSEIFTPYTNSHPVCLDDPNGSTAVNTPLQVYHCHGYASNGTPQRWNLGYFANEAPGNTLYRITTQAGLCIGSNVSQNQLAGTRVMLEKCNFIGILWNLLSLGADSAAYPDFELELADTGYCMTLPDWSGRNSEPVVLEPCSPGNTLQHWVLG
jgi:hypothetical protein